VGNVYGYDRGDRWREVRGGRRKGSDRRRGVEYKWRLEVRAVSGLGGRGFNDTRE
jgi:hypothetical protein